MNFLSARNDLAGRRCGVNGGIGEGIRDGRRRRDIRNADAAAREIDRFAGDRRVNGLRAAPVLQSRRQIDNARHLLPGQRREGGQIGDTARKLPGHRCAVKGHAEIAAEQITLLPQGQRRKVQPCIVRQGDLRSKIGAELIMGKLCGNLPRW